MAGDVVELPLGLAHIRVLEVIVAEPRLLEVAVEATWLRFGCPNCGFKCHRVHDRRTYRIRDLEVLGRLLVLV